MKKLLKLATFFTAAAGFISIINLAVARIRKNGYHHPEDKYYSWRYGKIRYRVSGAGRPLLLVHSVGVGAGMHEWDSNYAELEKHFMVYKLDLLGFGGSEKPNLSYSAYMYVSLINDFIKNVIGESVFAVGSADSASFISAAAALIPENFEKMLLVSPSGFDKSKDIKYFEKKLIESPIAGTSIYQLMSSESSVSEFIIENVTSNEKEVKRLVTEYVKHVADINSKYPIAALVSGQLWLNPASCLKEISAPVRIVWGERNRINPPVSLYDIFPEHENVELEIYEDSMLMPHVDAAARFNADCISFFKR